MVRKRAKTLDQHQTEDLLFFAQSSRHPLRNRVIVLLSLKAGLRAAEIANLTWDMVVDAVGEVGTVLELQDRGQERQWPGDPAAPRAERSTDQLETSAKCRRPDYQIAARWPNAAHCYRMLVCPRLSATRSEGLLVAFRPPHVHHQGCSVGSQGRRFLKGCPAPCRPSLDSNYTAIH